MMNRNASRVTAENTLIPAVKSFASEAGKGRGLLFGKSHTYDNGAYLQLYNHDGSELLFGSDVFDIKESMTDLLAEKEAGKVFLLDTEEARAYVYFIPTGLGKAMGKGGKSDGWLSLEEQDETEKKRNRAEREEANDDDEKDDDDDEKDDEAEEEAERYKKVVNGEKRKREEEDEEDSDEDIFYDFALLDSLGALWAVGILPLEGMDNLMDSVVKIFSFTIPLVILLGAFCGWVIAGKSLKPLGQITTSARSICDGQDLSLRLPVKQRGDEVQELSETFNGMMERLQISFESERQFTSDAAHELRTPTAVILAESEMALSYPEKDQALTDSLEEIHRQARKMTDLIRALLSYTRLEQGTRRIEKERLELSELASDICEEQRVVAPPETEILFEGGKEVWVEGDVSLLIILISNLISNAVKYGKDGGHVWVKVREEKQRGEISVRDDGIGISPEDLGRIWNRFYQADKARSDEEKRGIGLGLSLAKQIARLHGGEIRAASTLGEGSEFIFSMPLDKKER
ncbi:MAG: HAMP domain-containing histidine kinase [Blautia sp.]|nr:HAMP domain-containing histidine kinase [Blautia sp.]